MEDLEQMKERLTSSIGWMEIGRDPNGMRRIMLALIEHIERIESLHPELFTTEVRQPI